MCLEAATLISKEVQQEVFKKRVLRIPEQAFSVSDREQPRRRKDADLNHQSPNSRCFLLRVPNCKARSFNEQGNPDLAGS